MEAHHPIQQDWISEPSLGANFDLNVCANVGAPMVLEPINAGQSDTPLGATLPLFSGPEQNKYPVIEGTERNQLQRQLTGSWVRALQPLSDSSASEPGANATEVADPVLQHLNSAMDLAHSLRSRSSKRSYRQRKSTGVLICQHLVAALKLADEVAHLKS
jgi:hypothetical protein